MVCIAHNADIVGALQWRFRRFVCLHKCVPARVCVLPTTTMVAVATREAASDFDDDSLRLLPYSKTPLRAGSLRCRPTPNSDQAVYCPHRYSLSPSSGVSLSFPAAATSTDNVTFLWCRSVTEHKTPPERGENFWRILSIELVVPVS
jgi:hypothetical protein